MDIKVAITRTGVLLATYLVVLGVPFAVGWWGRAWLEQAVGAQWWLVPLGLCTVLATAGPFAYAYLRNQVEARLLKGQRQYRQALQHAARGMTRVREVIPLANLVVRVVSRTVGVEHASLFLLERDPQRYVMRAYIGPKELIGLWETIAADHPAVQWLRQHRGVLSKEGLPELRVLEAGLIVPGFIEHELVGFLVLGDKRSGQPYSQEDVHAFVTLANEAAVAIENAKSYEELQRANEQLRLAYDRLVQQERLVAAGQFATGLAHEIKNPLASIKTFAAYLPERYRDPTFRGKFSRIVQSEIDRINALVKELSDFAKPSPLSPQAVRMSGLLDEMLALISSQCVKQGVQVVSRLGENGLMIQADPQQLKQVFLNLFLNSLDAMPTGGRLEVSTGVKEDCLTVSVRDTGCGISEDHQAKLWDPFFTTKERGMGLGMAIVKGIVERHGGTISLQSRVGAGTTIEISLPVVQTSDSG